MNRKALASLTVTHGVNDMYQSAVPAMLPFLVAERGYGYALVTGLTMAATGLSTVVQPAFGFLVDRKPIRWLAPAGMVLGGIGVGLAGLIDGYPWVWLMVALAGIGSAAYHPAAAKTVREIAGPSARSMSVFVVGGSIGTALSPLFVSGILGTNGMSGTWLLAVPALLTGVVWAVYRRNRFAGNDIRPAATDDDRPTPPSNRRAFGTLAMVSVLWSIPFVVTTAFLALYVLSRFPVTAAAGAATLSAFTGGGVVGTLAGGWISGRWGRRLAIRLGYPVAVAAMLVLVLAPGIPWVIAASMVLGTAMFVPFAAQITLAQDYLPGNVGTASGVTLGLTASVGGLLAPAFGAIADAAGVRAVLTVLIPVLAAATVLAWRLPVREPVPVG